jgi:hypothetical protein
MKIPNGENKKAVTEKLLQGTVVRGDKNRLHNRNPARLIKYPSICLLK